MRVDIPESGFYKTRLVKKGPWVAVRIWIEPSLDPDTGEPMDRPDVVHCLVDGKPEADPYRVWTSCAGRPITGDEYEYLRAMRHWATEFDPLLPDASPTEPVNWQTVRVFK